MTSLRSAIQPTRSRASSGNVALLFALLLPALLLGAGAGIDWQRWSAQKSHLQEFADAMALRGAREFLLANVQPSQIKEMIESAADGDLARRMTGGAVSLSATVDSGKGEVFVEAVQQPLKALIMSRFSPYKDEISATATAAARGGTKVCIVALADAVDGAVSADNLATLDATPCSILSNSTASKGIQAKSGSRMKAGLICSVGGYEGSAGNFTPTPTTDCPEYPDPLAARQPPPVGGCDHQNFQIGYLGAIVTALPLIQATLQPGVYCGGLKIAAYADVHFNPGVYVIKGGPLTVGQSSTLEGDYVGFYLADDLATFSFEAESRITMSAPKSGPLAGVLFFESRDAPLNRTHRILSNDARRFIGTFYLSRGTLEVNTNAPVADSSSYTAIVARRLTLAGSPTLKLNTDYNLTDVPVPSGVGPVGGEVYLRD